MNWNWLLTIIIKKKLGSVLQFPIKFRIVVFNIPIQVNRINFKFHLMNFI